MARGFKAGDDLVFQLESGYGLLRILEIDETGVTPVWHLLAYEELFPDVESAEKALAAPSELHASIPHMALTDRAFERTPVAQLGNRPITGEEMTWYNSWIKNPTREVSDRSALLMLGLR